MAKIKLFTGMDFSGKSCIINKIDEHMPGFFRVQKKFITPVETLENIKDIWMPDEVWKPLLQRIIKQDIASYQESEPILQDTLEIVKYMAKKLGKNNFNEHEEIEQLLQLLRQYPDMDSFYITTTTEERIRRYNEREALGGPISGSDKDLFDTVIFERTENHYKNIILNRFPNTRIIDTTGITLEETVSDIMQDKVFLSDL